MVLKKKELFMRDVKRWITIFFGLFLIILLFELIYYPFDSVQLSNDVKVKTVGSLMVLTDETPRQLQIYHRAFLLSRYRLDCAVKITEADFRTANKDLFQEYALSVENDQIILDAQKNSSTPILLLATFLIFTVLLCRTMDIVQ